MARRNGAEASLGNAILGMSRYAQRRIEKKTDVRPGRTSGFSWPTRGRLTQGYGRHHDGIDIASFQGTPIRAAAIGVVSYVGWNPWDQHGRAFMIVVAHPGGFETLYGHTLPKRAVRVGQVVRKGQVIGYMGSTGNATGVHLHLELRRGRVTLNPLAYL
jgi:murein DD-endopeptidase MepM/ murein hydrolase activator NlpD